MRALSYAGERQIVVRDKPEPRPGPDEVVIAMKASAICGSDLHPYRHPRPEMLAADLTPGHEACGVIVECGPAVRGLTSYQLSAISYQLLSQRSPFTPPERTASEGRSPNYLLIADS